MSCFQPFINHIELFLSPIWDILEPSEVRETDLLPRCIPKVSSSSYDVSPTSFIFFDFFEARFRPRFFFGDFDRRFRGELERLFRGDLEVLEALADFGRLLRVADRPRRLFKSETVAVFELPPETGRSVLSGGN